MFFALCCLIDFLKKMIFIQSGDARVWEAVLEDGFAVLFGSALWPVTTATMRALEVRFAYHDCAREFNPLLMFMPELKRVIHFRQA